MYLHVNGILEIDVWYLWGCECRRLLGSGQFTPAIADYMTQ